MLAFFLPSEAVAVRQRYYIHGVHIDLHWDDPPIGEAVQAVLRHFGRAGKEGGRPPHATLRLSTASSAYSLPAGATEAVQYEGGITAWRLGPQVILGDGMSAVVLEPDAGRGFVHPSLFKTRLASRTRLMGLLVLSLSVLLGYRQRYALHAAALARGDAGVLLVAGSDAGKSTLAYSLVRQGWHYLSDDSVLLRPGGAGVTALTFRRMFGLDAEARRYFPEITSVWEPQLAKEEKRFVAVEQLYPEQAAERCLPRVLLFPQIVDRSESRLAPIQRADALLALLRQSALATLGPDMAARHLAALKRLTNQTQRYRFLAGRDLREEPARVSALLEKVIPAGKPSA